MKIGQPTALVIPVIFVLLVAVVLILNFNGLYGQDSHEYFRYTLELRSTLFTSQQPGPFFWPVYYPLAGAFFSLLIGNTLISLQGISILAMAFTAFFLILSIQELFRTTSKIALLFIGVFFVLAPFIFRTGLIVMSEMLSLFFITGGIYFGLKYLKAEQFKHLLLFAGFCSGAVFTRYNALLIIAPFVLSIGWTIIRNKRWIHLLGGLVIAFLCILPQWIIHQPMTGSGMEHYLLNEWSVLNFFRNEFHLQDGHLSYTLPNFIYAFQYLVHPGFTFLGIPLLVLFGKKQCSPPLLIILGSMILYSVFLMGLPTQNDRLMIPVFPMALLLLYPGFTKAVAWANKRNWVLPLGLGLLVLSQGFLIKRALNPFVELNRFERNLVNQIDLPNTTTPIYTFSVDGALKSYGVQNPIYNLWYDNLPLPDSTAYALFNPTQFQEQWEGRSVMYNWQQLNAQGSMDTLENLPHGWVLYQYNR